jgi:uncharacterized surface anchored protein
MASNTALQPITLHFQNAVRVAGETIAGSVDLNLGLAQEEHIEELRIKFRGATATYVSYRGSVQTSLNQTQANHDAEWENQRHSSTDSSCELLKFRTPYGL